MKEKEIFNGAIFRLIQKEVKIHGKSYSRDIIRHPGGVGVLVIKDNQILLVQQHRHAIDKDTLEIPAGKLEYGEDPKEAGLRELNEETGFDCKEFNLIRSLVSTPGFCDERIWIYEAIDIFETKNKLPLDEDEDISLVWIPIEKAYEMTKIQEIDDAKTIIAIDYAMIERKKG